MNLLTAMRVFDRVCLLGSLSAAARDLHRNQQRRQRHHGHGLDTRDHRHGHRDLEQDHLHHREVGIGGRCGS